ncbi:phage tail length tape measure family protein [Brucella intermedia]|uniref:phage tail length tape measure family protein n=1 Tax=Brucella intermedia TaxID=94625 RepID=UPI00224ADFAC|nr:phage tail length tape measure family protein [Brucella intermedia]
MADIATLGLEVNSGQVDNATRSLNKMAGAARVAEQAASGFTGVATKAASSLGLWTDKAGRLRNATGQFASMQEKSAAAALASAGALDEQSAAALRASQSYKQFGSAANDNIKAASKFNTANIAAQFQDIAVSAQMGMGAFQIGLQQGTQLAAVVSMMENPLRGLGAAFMSVISPVSLLTIGLVSLAAAGLQMVDWPKRVAQALILLADNLKIIAPYATAAAAGLALIYSPQIIGGVVSLIAWLGRLSVAAVTTAAAMAAANPGAAFVLGITAAVAAANIFRDELQQILGIDIVGEAKKGVNKIIGFFVGAYNAISAMWKNLPTLFSAVGKEAWNALVSQFEKESLWVEIAGKRFTLFEGLDLSTLKSDLSDIEKSALSTSKAFVDASTGDVDYLGGFTDAIGRGASAASNKLRELAKGLTDVDDKSKKGRKRRGKTDAEYYQDIIDGADRRIASLLVEQQALGMTEEAANALRYEQEMLNQAQQHGIDLTPKQADYIKMLAGTMAGLESAIQKAQDAINFAKDTTKGFFSDMANGLANGRGLWGSLADAAVNAINKIADALIDSGIESLFGGGGVSKWIGSLFGGGGLGGAADPWSGLRLASGGYVTGPGSATSDSIPAWLSNGEFVMNAKATKAFGPWLQAMNDNKVRGFAYGGPVDGNVVSMPSRSTLPSVREAAVSGSQQTVRIITETRFVNDGNFQNYIKSEVEEGSAKTFKAGIQKYDKGGAVRAARDLRQVNQRGYAK